MEWNCNGIKNKIGELINYLSRCKVDVAILLETKLRYNDKLQIRNYSVERSDINDNGGRGVAVVISNRVNYKRLPQQATQIEHVCLQLENGVLLTGVYASPNRQFTENDLNMLIPNNRRSLTLGDFNARHKLWHNKRQNRHGSVLAEFVTSNANIQLLHPRSPTHFPPNGMSPSIIDLAINSGLRDLSEPRAENALSSDHLPVHIRWNEFFSRSNQIIYNYANFNWNLFRYNVSQNCEISGPIETPADLDTEVEKLTRVIQKQQRLLATKMPCAPYTDHLPPDILNLIKFRNKVRKKWQTFRRELDRLRYNALSLTIREKISTHKNKCWSRLLSNLTVNDSSLWRVTKKLNRRYQAIPTISYNNDEFITNQGKSEAFAEFLTTIHSDTPNTTPEQLNIEKTGQKFVEHPYPIAPNTYKSMLCTPSEICQYLRRFPNNKAPGPDGITYLLLKNLPRKAIVQLTHISNAILKLQYFPQQWKKAVVILIPKPGKNPSFPSSYRPISLLNTQAKLIEKVMLARLNKVINKQQVIPKEQFGFRPGHNTTLLAAKVVNDIFHASNKQMNTAALFLDMERAFDTVWHMGLIQKLGSVLNLPLHFVSLLHSYISGRSFQTKIENFLSNPREMKAGVPQGSVLSPLLYSLYISDIPKLPTTKLALYADDTIIYNHSFYAQSAKQRLAHYLTLLLPYYNKWKLKVNATKTELVVFTKKYTNHRIINPLILNGTPIHQQKTAKYLGIVLDERLYFKNHVSHAIQRTFAAQQKLYPLINPKSPMSPSNKLTIYKMIIRPTLLYGAPVWNIISDTQRKRLQLFQNRILRGILSVSRYTPIRDLHHMTGVELVSDFIDNISNKFYKSQIHGCDLTKNLTSVRYDPDQRIIHGPVYRRLPIFYEQWQPP